VYRREEEKGADHPESSEGKYSLCQPLMTDDIFTLFFSSIFSSHFELSCEKRIQKTRTNNSYIFFLPYLQRTKKKATLNLMCGLI